MIELTGSQKLSTLIDFLGGVPDPNYNQSVWGEVRACGTCGCALGWGGMALSQELGYVYDPNEELFKMPSGETFGGRRYERDANGVPKSFSLAMQVFGMTEREAVEAFGSGSATRCQKIAELRELVLTLEQREREEVAA